MYSQAIYGTTYSRQNQSQSSNSSMMYKLLATGMVVLYAKNFTAQEDEVKAECAGFSDKQLEKVLSQIDAGLNSLQ